MFARAKQLSVLLLGSACLWGVPALAADSAGRSAENMPIGVTPVSQTVYDIHMLMFWICVVIGVLTFGALIFSLIAYRKSKGAVAANFHESTKVEIAWTVIPFIILIGMAWPATTALIEVYDSDEAELDIKVTGSQWKWSYDYIGEGVSFISNLSTPKDQIANLAAKGENYLQEVDEPLVVPVGKKIRFLVTASDVIHSWWVPDLAVKRDAIPGFTHESWALIEQPGTYRGFCAELCGKDHAFMPIVVEAVPEAEYNDWLAQKKKEAAEIRALTSKVFTLDELMTKGKEVYTKHCSTCHMENGEGVQGAFPALKGSAMATTAEGLAGHLDIVVNGNTSKGMPAWGTSLPDVELAAVITYERNAWGNGSGDDEPDEDDIVQPIDVYNFKKGE
ncbi:cytochrome c oxidase subunit II [Porticoccus sp. W117]|uniref:cytochrome c oxidase subunit II n=1 Tax=Porticoccus sp. W117 TaxID=3054777 RepID=UPI0025981EDA|nr:cytochrome c oxidase subunit II [Porticoccus sp. W117]MDM3870821.1 cytochrome c oxidase subunit II [Porticoccus sp. W117]